MSAVLFERVFSVMEMANPDDKVARGVSLFINALIFLNVIAVVLETVPGVELEYADFLHGFEVFSIVVFSIEYVLRIATCVAVARYRRAVVGRIKFALTPFAIIDLLAILPFYLPLIFPFDLRFVRALRLLRVFRILKLGRYANSMRIIGTVIRNKREELVICFFTVVILLVVASSLVFYVERQAQPDGFSSIPAAMWWGVATLTTVGYGDLYPVTALGKVLASMIAFLGVGMFALPAGILASGFTDVIKSERKSTCPHCGKPVS